jgi:hypothetical protein
MSKVYRRVLEVCWGLGLICTLASIVLKPLLMLVQYKLGVTPRGSMMLAAVFFLGALATGEARKTLPPS